ncbi:zinc-ribbon and DUF3426 domain-containing protein [Halorhodospira halochloris]|uniref:zinc-ribbon and DUF3426 domain-containing protein n=1 Tax=Halorhodospira halochloris TaxID=1052 RepID=UPI0030846067
MYTQCPGCGAIFALRAWQLRKARGSVVCGLCRETFDAMQTLSEELPEFDSDNPAFSLDESRESGSDQRKQTAAQSSFASAKQDDKGLPEGVLESTTEQVPAGDSQSAGEQGGDGFARESAKDESNQDAAGQEGIAADQQLQITGEGRGGEDSVGADLAGEDGELDDLSELELAIAQVHGHIEPGRYPDKAGKGLARRRGGASSWVKSVGGSLIVAAVILGGLLHGSYVMRDQLLEVPALYDWLDFVCGLYDCQLETQQSYQVLRVEERTLEEHPNDDDALVLGATLVHTGSRRLPYPDLELILRDLDGHVTRQGVASPRDYVADSRQRVRIDQGIEPGSTVPVRLEFMAPDGGAESFTIRFHPPQR